MWGYYGSKARIAGKYPSPVYGTIIEPFAGTAQYSLRYWDRRVILVDKYDVVCDLWRWLQKCSKDDILSIRKLRYGESVDDFGWDCQEQKNLVGFLITGGSSTPKNVATRWKTVIRPNAQQFRLTSIANNLDKIRHWEIVCGNYSDAPNIEATWFIDPPYVVGGKYYKHGSRDIDYGDLANWCQRRLGQVIVCESEGQDWLPFKPLLWSHGSRRRSREVVWTNENHAISVNN